MNSTPTISRIWAMPNSDTFDIKPIGAFVKKYLARSSCSLDLFARNKRWATHSNDLNPATAAEFHMEAGDFLIEMANRGVKADLAIVDPPYSPRQTKECYDGIGLKMKAGDALLGQVRRRWKELLLPCLTSEAIVLTFGWNTVGMGLKNGFAQEEILLVCHGSDHNDTICLSEKRLTAPLEV